MNTGKKARSPRVLADNLRSLMDETPGKGTQMAVAKAAGIAQTSVGLMLNPDNRRPSKSGKLPSPRLSEVEAVATAFGLEAWQLLIDPQTFGTVVAKALTSRPVSDKKLKHFAKPTA